MTPQDFIAKWGAPDGVPGPAYALNEEQGAQSHFLDLCELLDVPKPGSSDGYLFEEKSALIGGRTGYADVFMRGVFAWENKAPGKSLDVALKQLLTYSLALSNPPLLVVSDRLTIRIHTQFTGHPSETHELTLEQLDQPEKLALLRRVWSAPESFKPKVTNRDITETAAKSFSTLAEGLRRRARNPQAHPEQTPGAHALRSLKSPPTSAPSTPATPDAIANQVAHFLTQCLFCFFAEDVGLLPGRMFERLVTNRKITPDKLTAGLSDLFGAMGSGGMFGADEIPWFNGGLFKTIDVPTLTILDVTELRNAAALNWSAIDVSIFGTLFERGLDPSKRSQLGAHYTDTATIDRIIEPVLRRPLLQKWQVVAQEISALQAKSTRKGSKSYREAQTRFIEWLSYLKNYRVLDPACGSGNFLFLGLKALKDIEHRSHLEAAALGLDREADLVTGPHNVLGIELNEYAAELARVTVWIGELQWRMAHGYEFKTNPVLEPLDHIECRDALLSFDSGADSEVRAGQMPGAHTLRSLKSPPTSAPPTPRSETHAGPAQAVEATWPKANVVIGNPPFLGDKKMRSELGDAYTETLRKTYEGRVPGGADLVCYWFEKARIAIEGNGLGAAGLVATNSIRQAANRKVLDRVCQTTQIFEAWSDEPWVNEGAAVRVSLVCMGGANSYRLNGLTVERINADLTDATRGLNLTLAKSLKENLNCSFFGLSLAGDFVVDGNTARSWLLHCANPNARPNSDVLTPIWNGADVTRRAADRWAIDFALLNDSAAMLYEQPFEHVVEHVKPMREKNNRESRARLWWRHGEARPAMRVALSACSRFIVTSETSKHRYFVWCPVGIAPEHKLVVIPRADDVTFGILSSRVHIVWALATGSSLEDRPVYTTSRCLEQFPFPAGLTPADTAHQQTEQVAGGALIPAFVTCANGLRVEPAMTTPGTAITTPGAVVDLRDGHQREAGTGRMLGAISKSEAYEPPASAPPPPVKSTEGEELRQQAIAIAKEAKRLNDLRENWLNPPEWTHKVPEVTPLGMSQSPYPDRIEPKPGISETDLKALQQRTLTKLYNQRPAWLNMAHQQLDAAVATAYGWTDYTTDMPDEEILKRLLALNLQRSDKR